MIKRWHRVACAVACVTAVSACGVDATGSPSRATPGARTATGGMSPTPSSASPDDAAGADALIYRRDGAFHRWNGTSAGTDDAVVATPGIGEVWSVVVAGTRAFWLESETADPASSALLRSSQMQEGAPAETLLRFEDSVQGLAAAGDYIYWVGPTHVGRVRTDGSNVNRTFLALRTEGDGLPAADGLAADGEHLYFTQCGWDRIGKVELVAAENPQITWLFAHRSCPVDIAVDDGYVYWTSRTRGENVGAIGRVSVNGESPQRAWFNIGTGSGPFSMAAVGGFVYWSWGGIDGSPTQIGRVARDGSQVSKELISGGVGPLAPFPSVDATGSPSRATPDARTATATGGMSPKPSSASPDDAAGADSLIYRRDGAFHRWNGTSPGDDAVVAVPGVGFVWAVVTAGTRVFWVEDGSADVNPDTVLRSSRMGDGAKAETLLRFDDYSVTDLAAAGDYIYWVGKTHVGRVRTDGSNANPSFLALPTEADDLRSASGLATDGEYLYFTQCDLRRIGKIELGANPNPPITWIVEDTSCPGVIAVDDRYVYWGDTTGSSTDAETTQGGTIGRVGVNGESPESVWFTVGARQGPEALAVVGGFVYWTSGGIRESPWQIGRVARDGSQVSRELIPGGEGPLAAVRTG